MSFLQPLLDNKTYLSALLILWNCFADVHYVQFWNTIVMFQVLCKFLGRTLSFAVESTCVNYCIVPACICCIIFVVIPVQYISLALSF